ncbi:hypothetical protein [Tardisphaera saccharovorans]
MEAATNIEGIYAIADEIAKNLENHPAVFARMRLTPHHGLISGFRSEKGTESSRKASNALFIWR